MDIVTELLEFLPGLIVSRDIRTFGVVERLFDVLHTLDQLPLMFLYGAIGLTSGLEKLQYAVLFSLYVNRKGNQWTIGPWSQVRCVGVMNHDFIGRRCL